MSYCRIYTRYACENQNLLKISLQLEQLFLQCKYQEGSFNVWAKLENIVDEILFVTDMDAAFAAAVKCRQDVFSGTPVVASTIVQIQRLAFSELMIEIKVQVVDLVLFLQAEARVCPFTTPGVKSSKGGMRTYHL
jgi:hypothetical protein